MIRIQSAVLGRLALVATVALGLGGLHAGFSAAPTEASASAPTHASRVEARARTAPTDSGAQAQGYGWSTCTEGQAPCNVEYCAAPADSALGGYAVPCGPGRG